MKKAWLKNFVYDWPLYVILPVLSGVLISYSLTMVHQPQANEKLNVFVASSSLDSRGFCMDIKNEFVSDGLKEVTTAQSNPSDSTFYEKLEVVGYGGSDLFILPESALAAINPDDSLLRFSSELKTNYVSLANPLYYGKDGYDYGVRIKQKGEASPWASLIGFLEEDYYLCLNVSSKNIGDYGLYTNAEYNLGLQTFRYLQKESA